LRLFVVGYARRHWDSLEDSRSRNGLEIAERFADGKAGARELHLGWRVSFNAAQRGKQEHHIADWSAVVASLDSAGEGADFLVHEVIGEPAPENAAELAVLSHLLRDVFGNPFRPVQVARSRLRSWLKWNDGTIRQIARAIYDERAFERLPVLADALE